MLLFCFELVLLSWSSKIVTRGVHKLTEKASPEMA